MGPSPEVTRKMGLKSAARELAASVDVPVVPADMQFPIIIKASAGGGGRGVCIARDTTPFQEAFESARSEAERSFGDGSMLVQRCIDSSRLLERPIFGDAHRHLILLVER